MDLLDASLSTFLTASMKTLPLKSASGVRLVSLLTQKTKEKLAQLAQWLIHCVLTVKKSLKTRYQTTQMIWSAPVALQDTLSTLTRVRARLVLVTALTAAPKSNAMLVTWATFSKIMNARRSKCPTVKPQAQIAHVLLAKPIISLIGRMATSASLVTLTVSCATALERRTAPVVLSTSYH